jgi:hypothetical protein
MPDSTHWRLPRARQGLSASHRPVLGGVYFILGFTPITALALSLTEIVPLYQSVLWGLLPLTAIGGLIGLYDRALGQVAGTGLLIGLLAVLLYDGTRIPFLLAGLWADFIPEIATHLVPGMEPNWILGYLWRYLGNGGGMGMAFVVAYVLLRPGLNVWGLGVGYGVAIWCCLLTTLGLMPAEADPLFPATPLLLVVSFVGHVVYGLGLAWGLHLFGYAPDQ